MAQTRTLCAKNGCVPLVVAVLLSAGAADAENRDHENSVADVGRRGLALSYDTTDLSALSADANEPAEYDIRTTKWLTGDWGGLRTDLQEKGIDLSLVLTTSWAWNLRGGLETHNADASSADWRMNLKFDLDKMGWIPGGFFFIRGKSSWNDGVTADVGSLSPVHWVFGSSGDEEFFIDKWWYGQRLLGDRLELRVGKLLTPSDLFDNAVYATLPWDQFMNADLNRNPTVPHRKAPGAYMKVKLFDWADIRMAGIDADQTDSTRCFDVDSAFHGEDNLIGLWELVLKPKFEGLNGALPGNYRFGWWYDSRVLLEFKDDLGGLLAPRRRGDDWGWYLSFDQFAWKENDDPADKQGLGLFLRYGFAHPDINLRNHFWSVGAQYEGLIPNREKDVLAFGVAQTILSKTFRHEINSLADRETVYELYYAYHAMPWCVISPDIQVITNPGGNKNARDAVVGGVRFRIAF